MTVLKFIPKNITSTHEEELKYEEIKLLLENKTLTPEPVLTLTKEIIKEHRLAKELGITPYIALNSTPHFLSTHHYHCDLPQLSHKEKTINLFAFSLLLSQKGFKSCLWEHNRLMSFMHTAIQSDCAHNENLFCLNKSFEPALVMDSAIQLHLKQAGFSIQTSENEKEFTTQELKLLLHELLQSSKTTQTEPQHLELTKRVS